MVQVKSSVFERVNSIYNSVLLTLLSGLLTANYQFLPWNIIWKINSKTHISSQHCPFVPFFWAINIITSGSSLSCITAITLWLTSVSDTDLKVTMNPDSGELNEFENWSFETTVCLVTIDRNGQILNHGQKWVFFLFFTVVKFTIEALETIMKHLYDLIRYITWCHRVDNMLPCESACSVPHPSEINSKLVS